MSNIIRNKMKLEVLTPLHIGGADYKSKLDKKEYIFDKDKKTLTLIDNEKFIAFLIKKNLFEKYIAYIENNVNAKVMVQNRNINLLNFLKANNIDKDIQDFRKKAPIKLDMNIENMNDIKLMLRDVQGKPYIPGTSIKGALINLLLVDYIIKNREKFSKEKRIILSECKKTNDDRSIRGLKNDIKKIVNQIEKSIIYSDNKSLEKSKKFGISVSDSYSYSNTRTNFYQDIDEKRTNKSGEDKSRPMPVAREYIIANSIFDFDITLDIDLLEESKLKIKNIDDLIDSIENAMSYLIDVLEDKNSPRTENLVLGANTGFLQKTIVYALFEDEKERLEVVKKLLHKNQKNVIGNHLNDKFAPRVLNRIKINNKNLLAGLVKIMKVEEKNVGTN
ncbi:type III-A CRISPR-associated RAMP protein Csm5 [Fusobacterium periodonticum]|jgi:CRISPR-associated RAMP protein, csm5 family|uniref:CRISPR system Cms protein Csm5 n=3 Tax=Fusobacterium periodonticum TaxID=860 RepID=K1GIF4_9FUSO|nr:type III-A CRISPR-associated RAMP protein Csm5 [Fusobacterium periodonticum]AVQ25186.1 type III-A CRISPR-associated RAMP protein Csm5 [Fusobacterium periodonticum]EKA93809.1 CRISPR type III-a/mtube-associated ramp protein csm5 [Fusobacterium periodonticum D10]KGE63687.1 CRISPR type III-a/mtube-associated ramp protein csm5 [Fusobacterium periodonticum 2_1_31]MBF1191998.1 type III-A CRISPR-associated RAMP protein Csm5 [Fusobacterium periodonticum]